MDRFSDVISAFYAHLSRTTLCLTHKRVVNFFAHQQRHLIVRDLVYYRVARCYVGLTSRTGSEWEQRG